VALVGAAVLLACGCGFGVLDERRAALAREHQERMERLEQIEVRLLGAVSKRAEWDELRTRHGRVSELACENAAEHVEAMARHEEREKEKLRQKRSRRVAAVSPSVRPVQVPPTAKDLGAAPALLGEGGPGGP
jgi:predicted outer membrane lipoprotein